MKYDLPITSREKESNNLEGVAYRVAVHIDKHINEILESIILTVEEQQEVKKGVLIDLVTLSK